MTAFVVSAILAMAVSTASLALQTAPVNEDARTMADFVHRVEQYEEMRRNLMSKLPKRGEKASSEEIDRHRQGLADAIRQARADARPGALFTPEVQTVVRRLMKQVFEAPTVGANARQTINEDNPRGIALAVNKPYPDNAPLTTMPPKVLNNLPQLPDPLQYRFIGRTLILLDGDAELIIDYMPNAMP